MYFEMSFEFYYFSEYIVSSYIGMIGFIEQT